MQGAIASLVLAMGDGCGHEGGVTSVMLWGIGVILILRLGTPTGSLSLNLIPYKGMEIMRLWVSKGCFETFEILRLSPGYTPFFIIRWLGYFLRLHQSIPQTEKCRS